MRCALRAWIEARVYFLAAYLVASASADALGGDDLPISDGLLAWDGSWYELIASDGYAMGYDSALDPALRFFPLFALLGRALGVLLTPGVALVVIANLASLVAGVLLYRLVKAETDDVDLAERVVRLLALAPPAFVLVFAYSEGLFLVLSISVFYLMRQGKWWVAAVGGYLAGLTRPVGALLSLPVAVVAIRQIRRDGFSRVLGAVIAAVAPVAGMATFLLWSRSALDDWSAPLDRQGDLRGGWVEPVSRVVASAWRGVRGDEGELFHFLAAVMLVGLVVVTTRQLRAEYWLYSLVSVVLLLSADNLNSLERYGLAVFPLVIAGAWVSRHRYFDRWVIPASAVGMASLSVLALHGIYVP